MSVQDYVKKKREYFHQGIYVRLEYKPYWDYLKAKNINLALLLNDYVKEVAKELQAEERENE